MRSWTQFALTILGVLLLVVLLAPRGGDSLLDAEGRPTRLRFADTGIEGMEELRRAFGPFVAALESIAEVPIEFFPVGNRTIAATALEHGQVELVLAGPTEYLFIEHRGRVHPVVGIQRPAYHTAIFVPIDSPAQTIADLRGRTIAMKSIGSTSGHVMPSAMLLDAGLDLDRDLRIQLLGGARIEALLAGEVDALADGIRVWETIERRAPGRFRILAESPPLPRDVLLARGDLSESFVATLRAGILAENDRLIEAMVGEGGRERYHGARFTEVDEAEFESLRRTHAALGLPY